jgi:tRNA uridine 5-carbamoylmethylation protein Kti12
MKTLILLCGIPGSGKSSWARDYAKSHPDTFICDTDETRKKITGSYLKFPEHMEVIFDDLIAQANAAFAKGGANCTVIEDAAFLDNYRRLYFMKRIRGYDKAVLLLIKMKDYSICYERNRQREKEKWVPDSVISDMIKRYEDPTPEVRSYFSEVQTEWWN